METKFNFERGKDPLESMNIGLNITKFDSIENLIDMIIRRIPMILGTTKIPGDILFGNSSINNKYYKKIIEDINSKDYVINGYLAWDTIFYLKKRLEKMGF